MKEFMMLLVGAIGSIVCLLLYFVVSTSVIRKTGGGGLEMDIFSFIRTENFALLKQYVPRVPKSVNYNHIHILFNIIFFFFCDFFLIEMDK